MDAAIVEQTLARLTTLQILLPHQAEVIEPEHLAQFFQTEPGTELLRADWVKQEIPFIYGLPAEHSPAEWVQHLSSNAGMQSLDEDSGLQASLENETVLVQGIVIASTRWTVSLRCWITKPTGYWNIAED